MTPTTDTYREWDAAYVLGALSPLERREFEDHLAGCERCAAAVAELAVLPGLLGKVSEADASVDAEATAFPSLLPGLIRATSRHRRRIRALVGGIAAAATVAAATLALVIPLAIAGTTPGPGRQITLSQVVASPLTADLRLVSEAWGTRIDMTCRYAVDRGSGYPAPVARRYALFVIDSAGRSSEVATWSAGPGSTVHPSGTTSLRSGEIRSVEVRSADTGKVLLQAPARAATEPSPPAGAPGYGSSVG